ncbi:MAG: Ig-like domain-containing protein [Verrucomicrobia bacterium]|nr:Ig-like domain-containing protein [Verrucomicrobiota bacterium]
MYISQPELRSVKRWQSRPLLRSVFRATIFVILLAAAIAVRAQSPPKLVSVTPADGSSDVSTNSTVVFKFDQDMDVLAVVPIASFPPVLIGNFEFQPASLSFTGAWGGDKRTLTIKCLTALPFDTTISWKLNPPGGTIFKPFSNTSGQALATLSGSFKTMSNVAAGPAPKLVSVSPANGFTGVSPTSPVTFTFDQTMDTSVKLTASFPPFSIGNYDFKPANVGILFNGSWGADQKTLTFKTSFAVTPGTTVTWTLNPSGTQVPLKSATGVPLALATGNYTILSDTGGSTNELCQPAGQVPNLGTYFLSKTFNHQQLSANAVVPNTNSPANFNAFVQNPPPSGTASGNVTNMTVVLPGGGQLPITNQLGFFSFNARNTSEAALEAAYPPGAYKLHLEQTGLGAHDITMNLPVPPTSIPTITNYDAAQAIDATQSFTLRWNLMTPQRADAFVSVTISDAFGKLIFFAPNPCIPRALASTDTSVVIPANYLRTGLTYIASLQFGYTFYNSTNDVPKMAGSGNVVRLTAFTIQTTGAAGGPGGGTNTGLPATFTGFRVLPNGDSQLDVSGTSGKSYSILRAPNLTNPQWITVGTATMDPTGKTVFTDTDPALKFPAYYEAVNN